MNRKERGRFCCGWDCFFSNTVLSHSQIHNYKYKLCYKYKISAEITLTLTGR